MIMKHSLSLVLISALSSSIALAVPDAGTIQRDIEKNLQKQQPRKQKQTVADLNVSNEFLDNNKSIESQKIPTDAVILNQMDFKGNELISSSELQKALARHIGQRIELKDILLMTEEINAYYRSKGMKKARAFVYTSDIKDDSVIFTITTKKEILEKQMDVILNESSSLKILKSKEDGKKKLDESEQKQIISRQQPKEEDETILIKGFSFSGNTIISSDDLQKVVVTYSGKEFTFNALQKVVAKVSDYYASQGGLAKVYLPKQDITGGLVSIAIVEGKLNSVIIDNKEAKLSTPTAENYIYSQNAKNTPIKNKELSRALMNLNDLGGLKATSSLAPGVAEGSSDLVIKLKDGSKYSADIGVDNYGSKATGINELSAGININNISNSSLYDSLNIRTMGTSGVRFARLAYFLPIGYYGDKIGISQSAMTYKLVGGSVDGDGSSTNTAINWSHPFVRTKEFNINLINELSKKIYNDQAAGSPTDKEITVLNSTLSFDKADAFLGGGQNSASISVALGKVKKDGAGFTDTNNINGNYAKYSLNFSRQQYISDTLSLQVSLNAQAANKNLDGSEELSLGGANAVRAYPASEASGDMGYMANIELKYALNSELTPSVFVDYGRVIINKSNLAGADDNSDTIGGYGLALNYATSYNLSVKGQISRRLATNYNPNGNDTNSDGSKSTGNRYWVNASYFF
jgi:hemolysin activation/secretion protein